MIFRYLSILIFSLFFINNKFNNVIFPYIILLILDYKLKYNRQQKNTIIALINAIIVSVSSIYLILYELDDINELYGWTNNSFILCYYIFAYFLWDITICFNSNLNNPSFMIHCIMYCCYLARVCYYTPCIHYIVIIFGLFEISSIFLNIKYLFNNILPKCILLINDIIFIFTFIFFRNIIGIFYGYYFMINFYKSILSFDIIAIISITLLNLYWGYKIICRMIYKCRST